MDNSRDPKFRREVKHQKIFDTCSRILRNLDQWPNGALKTVFLKYGWNFGMDKPKHLKFCRENLDAYQNLDQRPLGGVLKNLVQGPNGALKTVFPDMARSLEQVDLET